MGDERGFEIVGLTATPIRSTLKPNSKFLQGYPNFNFREIDTFNR
jgi:hypothetical protein